MSFYKVSTSNEMVRDFGGSSKYINHTGMYDVIIKNVIYSKSKNGSEAIDLFIDYNGTPTMLYGAIRLTNNDGTPNLGANLFNKLLIVLGAEADDEIEDPISSRLPIGKGGEMKECLILDQFHDVPVTMRIQMDYSMYDGKIMEHKIIRNVFDSVNHATASEIINSNDPKVRLGEQYEKELTYGDKNSYRDGLTEEDVQAWIKAGRNGTPAATETKPSAGFGTKRIFSKN